jgi:hypothetical protein
MFTSVPETGTSVPNMVDGKRMERRKTKKEIKQRDVRRQMGKEYVYVRTDSSVTITD